jgi:peptide/nickel transport system permease protein
MYVQYWTFLTHAVHGDFGESTSYNRPALAVVEERMPATLELAALALGLIVVVGFALGLLAAAFRNSPLDSLATGVAVSGQSMPTFWFGTVLILLFGVHWHLFPTSGSGGLSALVLPAITLAAFGCGVIERSVRSSLLEVLGSDYIRTAWAKGLRARRVILVHAMRNGLIPPLTLLGLQVSTLFGGAIVTEQVFAYPGMGRLATQAVLSHDFPVVEAFVFVVAVIVLLVNFGIDLLYELIDPRIRTR